MKEFTVEELMSCNGVDRKELYVALAGNVYDVSSGTNHYGRNGGYHLFAGRDASRALAKGLLDESVLPVQFDDLADLTEDEKRMLQGWASTYEKYPIVDADKGNTRLLISAMTKHMRGTGVLVPSKSGRADDEEPSAPGPNVAKKQVDIFTAAKRGDTARLRELIQEGASISDSGGDGLTPLHCAAKAGQVDCVLALLGAGSSVDEANAVTGENALMYSSAAGHVAAVKVLLERGADVTLNDRLGVPALLTACANGKTQVAEAILDAGGPVDQRDREGWQALHWAAGKGQCGCINLLVERGADINAQDSHGNTPLYWAGKMGKEEAWDLLREKGADASIENHAGVVPALMEGASKAEGAGCCIQ